MSDKEISEDVKALANSIKEKIEIKEGVVAADDKIYKDSLPEGITMDHVKQLREHNSKFFPAASLAVGELAIKEFKKDNKLETVTASFPMGGRDHFDVIFDRQKETRNPSTGETSMKYAALGASMVVHAARASRGAMSVVKAHLDEAARAAYGK